MRLKQLVIITDAKSEVIFWDMTDWSKQKVLDHIIEGMYMYLD